MIMSSYLRLYGGMYVSGVSEEKELAVRDLLGGEIDFKALGMSLQHSMWLPMISCRRTTTAGSRYHGRRGTWTT